MRNIFQKPRAKRVRLKLKKKQHLLEYNSEVQATKKSGRCPVAQSLAHSKWLCKYHIVFTPKYRKKEIRYQLRTDI